MKKLAIGVLVVLVASACRRQAVVTSAPTQPPSTAAASNATGGATARDALTKFLAGVKAQDIQAVSKVWGSKDGGAAANDRRYMSVEDMEKRIIIMIRCARHDSWVIKGESPLPGGDRQFTVELKLGNLTGTTDFVAVLGPESRWFIREYDVAKMMKTVCQAA